MKKLYFIIFLLLVLLFTSCSTLNSSNKKNIKKQIINEKFILISPYKNSRIFISFTEDRVSGNSGVNMFMGNYQITDNKICMGPLASTKIGGRIEDLDREKYILLVLNNSKKISLENNVLTFFTDNNQILKFKKYGE